MAAAFEDRTLGKGDRTEGYGVSEAGGVAIAIAPQVDLAVPCDANQFQGAIDRGEATPSRVISPPRTRRA